VEVGVPIAECLNCVHFIQKIVSDPPTSSLFRYNCVIFQKPQLHLLSDFQTSGLNSTNQTFPITLIAFQSPSDKGHVW
jgi:hypothetical protein